MPDLDALWSATPGWWACAALALIGADLVARTAVLRAAGLGALATALALWAAPWLGPGRQFLLFFIVALGVSTVLARLAARPRIAAAQREAATALVGREAEVLAFGPLEGVVLVDGVEWPALLQRAGAPTPLVGARMRVVATDGERVWVQALRTAAVPPPATS
jgi:membrane protein implicated in regulation of membrane protease activity